MKANLKQEKCVDVFNSLMASRGAKLGASKMCAKQCGRWNAMDMKDGMNLTGSQAYYIPLCIVYLARPGSWSIFQH